MKILVKILCFLVCISVGNAIDFYQSLNINSEYIKGADVYKNHSLSFGYKSKEKDINYEEKSASLIYSKSAYLTLNTDGDQFYYGVVLFDYKKLTTKKKLFTFFQFSLLNIQDNVFSTLYEPIDIKLYSLINYKRSKNLDLFTILGPEFGFENVDYHNTTIDKYVKGGVLAFNLENYFVYYEISFMAGAKIKNTGNYFTEDYFSQGEVNINLDWAIGKNSNPEFHIRSLEINSPLLSITYQKNFFLEQGIDFDKLGLSLTVNFR